MMRLSFGKLNQGFLLVLGVVSLFLGLAGIVLPLLPTTPFFLLTAFCFSRASPRLHRWLLKQKIVGPTLRDWEENQIIRPRAKVVASVLILGSALYLWLQTDVQAWAKTAATSILLGAWTFVITRPSRATKI